MIDRTNRNTALAAALVEELARSGVTRAVVSPGSRSSPLALALDAEPVIATTVVLDERSAGFLALGCALATGAPSIVACTSGSAAANLHPAVVEADQAGVPLIVLTSDRPPELREIGAGQTIDQIGLYGGAVRWFSEVGTHNADDAGLLHLRSVGCRAHGEATGGRGPVHLNLSWRDPLGPEPDHDAVSATDPLALEGRSQGRSLTVPIQAREPSPALLDSLGEAIGRAERGLILAGRQLEPRLPEALVELAERCGLPILAEPTSQLRFGAASRGPATVISAYDQIARSRPAALAPDLILRFGDMPTSKPLRTWIDAVGADQIVIDPPGRWNEPSRRAGAFVRADAAAVAAGLSARVERADPAWTRRWTEAEQASQRAIDAAVFEAGVLSEPAVHRTLGEAFAGGDQVLLASSMPVRDAEAFLNGTDADVRFFSNRGANGIDGLVSTACGLAIGSRAPTWLILGDLALAHDLGGLAGVAGVVDPLRIVVIDNGGGGIFDFLPQADQVDPDRFERLFTTPSGLDLAKVADLFELPFEEIHAPSGLVGLAGRDRVLARIPIDRAGNVDLHRRIAAAVAAALQD